MTPHPSAALAAWALRTPLGATAEDVLRRLLRGERAAALNPHFPADTYACRVAAAIPGQPAPSPHGRILRRMGLYALDAAREALAQAPAPRGERLGVFAAMGCLRAHWDEVMPALARQRDDFLDCWDRGLRELHPFWMLRHLSNNAHALLAQEIDARGDGVTCSGACSGGSALAAASAALAAGAIDAALVLAYDSLIAPESIIEMAGRGALARGAPEDVAAPYDVQAAGAVPGEAAAAVLLLPPERCARPRAYLTAADGAGPTALGDALDRVAQGDGLVDGCALALPGADRDERRALARALAPGALLSAVQAGTGSLGAATAVVQAILLAAMLRDGQAPPIAGLRDPAPGPLVPLREPRLLPAGLRAAVGVSAGAPELAAAVRVSLPDPGTSPVKESPC